MEFLNDWDIELADMTYFQPKPLFYKINPHHAKSVLYTCGFSGARENMIPKPPSPLSRELMVEEEEPIRARSLCWGRDCGAILEGYREYCDTCAVKYAPSGYA